MNPFGAMGQAGDNTLGFGTAERLYRRPDEALRNWQPEHAPKVASLTQTLDEALKILQDVAARLESSVSKLSPIPMAQATGRPEKCAVEGPTYPAGGAAVEVRKVAERIKKLACELDERL